MNALRKSMGPMRADRLVMAIKTDDLIEAINIPLRARRGTFGVDYSGHTPELYAITAGGPMERIAFVDTRRRCAVWERIEHEPLRLMVEDIHRRLGKLGAELVFIVQQDKQGRYTAKLQIKANDSRHIVLWLAKVPRKTKQGGIGPFVITEGG